MSDTNPFDITRRERRLYQIETELGGTFLQRRLEHDDERRRRHQRHPLDTWRRRQSHDYELVVSDHT